MGSVTPNGVAVTPNGATVSWATPSTNEARPCAVTPGAAVDTLALDVANVRSGAAATTSAGAAVGPGSPLPHAPSKATRTSNGAHMSRAFCGGKGSTLPSREPSPTGRPGPAARGHRRHLRFRRAEDSLPRRHPARRCWCARLHRSRLALHPRRDRRLPRSGGSACSRRSTSTCRSSISCATTWPGCSSATSCRRRWAAMCCASPGSPRRRASHRRRSRRSSSSASPAGSCCRA